MPRQSYVVNSALLNPAPDGTWGELLAHELAEDLTGHWSRAGIHFRTLPDDAHSVVVEGEHDAANLDLWRAYAEGWMARARR